MPGARFFFDAGSGTVLWAGPGDRDTWGYAVDLDRLPIGPDLRAELERLIAQYDTSVNRDYPPDPGPWSEPQCRRFNAAVRRALGRLRRELGPAWEIQDAGLVRRPDGPQPRPVRLEVQALDLMDTWIERHRDRLERRYRRLDAVLAQMNGDEHEPGHADGHRSRPGTADHPGDA